MNSKITIFLFCSLLSHLAWSQAPAVLEDDKNEQIFNSYLQKNINKKQYRLDSLLIQTALFFLDTPYVASTLEGNENEQLVVNLQVFDCTTFVENCLALSRTLHTDHPNFGSFQKELQTIRYRDGIIDGYTSRLHYTSDWITNNQKAKIVEDKTQAIGGIILSSHINFMSTHPESYRHLSENPENTEKMRQIEDSINNRTYYYIPKEKIRNCEKHIKPGDIICFVTSIKGLDISHLGIAYRKNRILTFIHASTSGQKVLINPVSIADYCKNIKNNKGIIVLKVNHEIF